jgi:hypothetical protein|tara:strand:- start:1119 stop:1538 length:420 start_codon:yes stop_codon:yes gene_type:complete
MKNLFITFVIGAMLTACSIEKNHKTENQMEPRILAIGRLQSTLDVLVEEWERYGRNVIASNSKDRIKETIETESIDFICIGGGLPDNERDEMVEYISTINSSIKVHPIPRTEEAMGPYNFIPFLNNLAIMHKVRKAIEE